MKTLSLILLGTAGAVAVAACSPEARPAAAPALTADAHVAVVRVDDVARPFEAGGTVRARNTATIVSRIVADVREVRVTPGDRVRAGQPLVVLDARDLIAQRARAEATLSSAEQGIVLAAADRQAADAALALATATHRRMAELRAKNSATPNELDEAVAGLEAAQARARAAAAREREATAGIEAARAAVEGARVSASYAILTAPFDGIVTEKLVEPGNMASPGTPLVTVEDTGAFRLEARVDESRAALIAPGSPAEVVLDSSLAQAEGAGASPALLAGRVTEIARTLDPGSHAFLVKVALPPGVPVRSGMYGRARFAGPIHRGLSVPASSLVRRGQLTSVFVVDAEKTARMRLVDASDEVAGRVEVRSGLEAGERIVTDPSPLLVDGMKVRETSGQAAASEAGFTAVTTGATR